MASSNNSSVEFTLASLWTNKKYSDLKVICQDKTFEVHKSVVCTQSKVIARAIEEETQEAHKAEYKLDGPGYEWEIVEKFLKYLYTKDFDANSQDSEASETGSQSPDTPQASLCVPVKLYVMAQNYDVPSLKALAIKKYTAAISQFGQSPFIASSLRLLYEGTPEDDRELKEVAISASARQIHSLLQRPEFVALCAARADVSLDLLKSVSKRVPAEATYSSNLFSSDSVAAGAKSAPFSSAPSQGTSLFGTNTTIRQATTTPAYSPSSASIFGTASPAPAAKAAYGSGPRETSNVFGSFTPPASRT